LQQDPKNYKFEQINLYWGGRYLQDLYWKPAFTQIPVTFLPVLSREPSWEGKAGYIQDAALSDGLPLENSVVYACGSEAMIQDARATLLQAGLPAGNFYSDAFVQSGGLSL
jgi:CDP-4-dehydro-6-deoxyglucose reductase, E3